MVKVEIELSGGLEILFGNQKVHNINVPPGDDGKVTARQVISWARQHLLTDRPELFVKGDSVRPGILVLINDADWELSGLGDSDIEEGDTVAFISTLHGG